MKESSMEKSFKKESSSSLSNFARNSFTSDSDFGLSRRWLMPKGIFDEDLANFQLKVRTSESYCTICTINK